MKSSYSTQCKINRLLMVLAALAAVNWLPRPVAAAPLAQGTQPTAIYLPLVAQEIQPPTTPSNQAPTVMAGPDQTVMFPTPANLHGVVSDDGLPNPPGRLSIEWRKISGPAEVVFSQPNAVDTAVTFTLAGEYLLQLTASDHEQSASDQLTVRVMAENQSPTVHAGADQAITLPAPAQLNGAATDDGLPNPPGNLALTWSKFSGPGQVTFTNANALNTTAGFSDAGEYSLQLTVTDGEKTVSDQVIITVKPANQPPVVNAGVDQTVTLLHRAQLDATVSDDGLPNPPAHLTTTWRQTSGPGVVTFADPSAVDTTATFSAVGSYRLRLTATDGLLTAFDEISIQVNSEPIAVGHWAGTTSRTYAMSFDVATEGAQVSKFALTTNFTLPECGSSGVLTVTVTSATPIVDNQFTNDSLDFTFAGEFTALTAASGSYAFTNYRMIMSYPFPPYICIGYFNQSGTWTATKAD